MATFLICHGAWSGGWSWKKVRPLLRAAGHAVFTPTYTGLGERAHLAHPLVDLETHVADVLAVIEAEDLLEIVLVAHSYGGMVGTVVADRVPGRVRHLIYLDAFVPADGESLADLVHGGGPAEPVAGWLIPPMAPAPDTPAEDLAWTTPRRRHQPVRTFVQQARLAAGGAAPVFRRSYVHCTKKEGHDNFAQFADRFRDDPDWGFCELATSHSPNVTAPESLGGLLVKIG
jgi:pimeloyl-ACP methyl ester carboxylesterase